MHLIYHLTSDSSPCGARNAPLCAWLQTLSAHTQSLCTLSWGFTNHVKKLLFFPPPNIYTFWVQLYIARSRWSCILWHYGHQGYTHSHFLLVKNKKLSWKYFVGDTSYTVWWVLQQHPQWSSIWTVQWVLQKQSWQFQADPNPPNPTPIPSHHSLEVDTPNKLPKETQCCTMYK